MQVNFNFSVNIDDRIISFFKRIFTIRKIFFTIMIALITVALNASVPVTFTAGTTIIADDVNSNFDALDTRITTLEGNGHWSTDSTNVYRQTGNVGIGTAEPVNILSIIDSDSTVYNSDNLTQNQKGATLSINNSNTANNTFSQIIMSTYPGSGSTNTRITAIGLAANQSALAFSTENTTIEERMRINQNGNVGIGTSSPSYRLQVGETSNYGYVDSTGAWTTGSDRRYKENIQNLESALGTIISLRGVKYNTKGNDLHKRKQIGFIAQEVEKIIPEIVATDKKGLKGVAYSKLTPVLVEAIKELKSQNNALKRRILTLEAKIK